MARRICLEWPSTDLRVEASLLEDEEPELCDLLWSWFNYVNCLSRWFFPVFPRHLGKMFPLVKQEDVEELVRLHNLDVKRRS